LTLFIIYLLGYPKVFRGLLQYRVLLKSFLFTIHLISLHWTLCNSYWQPVHVWFFGFEG